MYVVNNSIKMHFKPRARQCWAINATRNVHDIVFQMFVNAMGPTHVY